MNPTGVMRESDRDMALSYLNKADSQQTYEAAVNQLLKQIRTECENASGHVNNSYTYEVTAPGRYVAILSDGSSAAREPPP